MRVALAGSVSGGHAQGDTLSGIENLTGSRHNDTLTGDDNDNVLRGGPGYDRLNGGGGTDWADYSGSPEPVTVNLTVTSAQGGAGHARGDRLRNIENLIGSAHNDTLTGDSGDNVLRGGAGADTLDGRGGIDTADYTGSPLGVNVQVNGSGSFGHAEGDNLSNIENVTGSRHNDTLTGDADDNTLYGGPGWDTLNGGLGADRLIGGAHNDRLFGGPGTEVDAFFFYPDFDRDTIGDYTLGSSRSASDTIYLCGMEGVSYTGWDTSDGYYISVYAMEDFFGSRHMFFQGSITLEGVSGLRYTNNTPPGNVNIIVPGRHRVDGRWLTCSEDDLASLVPPAVGSASVDGTALTLTFTRALNPNSRPAASAFTVIVDATTNNAVTNVAISGRTVTLTLTTVVQFGEGVTVAYTAPSSSPLEGSASGDQVETFPAQTVTNNSPTRVVGNTRSSTNLVGWNMDNDTAQAFTTGSATDGYQLHWLNLRMRDEGTTPPVYTMTIRKDVSGEPGTNDSDILGRLTGPSLPGDYAWLRFTASDPIDLEPSTKYWVMVDVTTAASDAEIHITQSVGADSGAAAGWSMANTFLKRSSTSTTWDAPATANYRISIFARAKTAPVFQSAEVDGTALTLTFSEALDGDAVTGAGGFTLKLDNGTNSTINGYLISGRVVELTLGANVPAAGQGVTVSYAIPSSNPLHHAGRLVPGFTDQPVTNNTS